MKEADLPMPMTWHPMPFRVDVKENSCNLKCHYMRNIICEWDHSQVPVHPGSKTSTIGDMAKQPVKISELISRDDVLRIDCRNQDVYVVEDIVDMDQPLTVVRDEVQSTEVIDLTDDADENSAKAVVQNKMFVFGEIHVRASMKMKISAKVDKKVQSYRKDPYVDLIVAHEQAKSQKSSGVQGLHEGGFAMMYKLMAGEPVDCPLCLEVKSFFVCYYCSDAQNMMSRHRS